MAGVKVLNQKSGKNWVMYHGDSCEVLRGIPDDSIGHSVFSPPFSSLYVYSNSERDLGNSSNYDEFSKHFAFIVRELYRVMKPGRLVSVHCMNLPTTKQSQGYVGLQDFRGDIINEFAGGEAADFHRAIARLEARKLEADASKDPKRAVRIDQTLERMREELREHAAPDCFIYHSEVCIWKDPVTAMQRTHALGLLHKQIVKDSCMSRQGIPDYVCTFRKPGINPDPVAGEFDRFIGDTSTFKQEKKLSVDVWQRYASPVWMDVNPSRTLKYAAAREENDDRHICALQLDVIERCMEMWSNPGDTVLSPFGGIASEGHVAVMEGRKFIGIELKKSYWDHAVANLIAAETKYAQTSRELFGESETVETTPIPQAAGA